MDQNFNILIADDDGSVYSASMKPFVQDLPQAQIFFAESPSACRKMIEQERFHFILLDISFGPNDSSGMTLLPEIRIAQPNAKIFMLSSHDDHITMLRCMQAGATDFISKRDINIPHIVKIIRGFIEGQSVEIADETRGLDLARNAGADFASRSMIQVYALAALAQRNSNTPVLITGETGVGKDVIAKAIGDTNPKKPFVAVDCGAITETLAESVLFGHERGSFTGADRAAPGKFQEANKGNLLLDEIGNLKRSVQEKLLRAIQNKEVTPLGGKAIRVDTRIIAATNEDLESLVREGRFRQDLLERLKGILIHIPPLRERPEDISSIIEGIIAKSVTPSLTIAPACMSLLTTYSWPGNVRELEHVIKGMIASSVTGPITVRHLPPTFMSKLAKELNITQPVDDLPGPVARIDIPLELELIEAENQFLKKFIQARRRSLGENPSNSQLASVLKISRTTLIKYIKRLKLEEVRK